MPLDFTCFFNPTENLLFSCLSYTPDSCFRFIIPFRRQLSSLRKKFLLCSTEVHFFHWLTSFQRNTLTTMDWLTFLSVKMRPMVGDWTSPAETTSNVNSNGVSRDITDSFRSTWFLFAIKTFIQNSSIFRSSLVWMKYRALII